MNFVSKIKENLFSIFQTALIVLLAILLVVFVGVLFFDCVENCISCLIGVTTKNEILIFLGIGIGGILIVLLARKIKENPLLSFLIFLLISMAVVFGVVMYYEDPKCVFELFGVSGSENPKYEVLKFLGIGMGGVLVALQALASHRRAKAMEDTAEHTEQGLRQERLKNAIEHLGNEKESMRWGGAYELFHLAKDSKELRQTVLDLLCLQIRQMTSETIYRVAHQSKPSEEVQSILRLLFVQEHEVFKNCDINLQGSWLNGADLRKARLQGAILTGVYLQKADLRQAFLQGANLGRAYLQKTYLDGAFLQGANFSRAYLQKAMLTKAHLQEAVLSRAYLQDANFSMAHLQGTDLNWSDLQGANLNYAYLQKADIGGVFMQGVCLNGAHLQGADLNGSHLQGAFLFGAHLQEANFDRAHLEGVISKNMPLSTSFVDLIQERIGQDTDLDGVIFEGGLKKKDLKSLLEGLSNIKAKELRERLKPHIDKPISHELPPMGDRYVFTGTYTKAEAELLIAEYEKAMSEVPEDDS